MMRRLPYAARFSRHRRGMALCLTLGLAGLPICLPAAKVTLRAVEASTNTRSAQLAKSVDGIEAGLEGWAVPGQTDRVHSAVFACETVQRWALAHLALISLRAYGLGFSCLQPFDHA
ncbi:hypothetical protein [Verrucomicrobium spinosum]|uniref:hypothetical protein n=1 Tax=Verrucomicrobium spinosum TaxID=2736 RepID=UPI001C45ECD6|nr:hypothetical protein [Verrucomicrobium spinosum]